MINLKALRKEKKLTLSDIANALGTSSQVISRYELGQREPDLDTLKKIADFFGVTTDYLLGREDDFGNVETNANLSEQEKELLTLFNTLPEVRKRTVLDTVRYMSEANAKEEKQSFKTLAKKA